MSKLMFSLRANNQRSIFLLFWISTAKRIFIGTRIKFYSAQFYLFHVSNYGVYGKAVCPFKQDGHSGVIQLELEQITPNYVLQEALQRQTKDCRRNLNRNPVRVFDVQAPFGYEANFTCHHFKNYFSQPNCGWNTWHTVLTALAERFNFTLISAKDPRYRRTRSFIQTSEGNADVYWEVGKSCLGDVEEIRYVVYKEPLEEIRRKSLSFEFWFKPFDISTWMLLMG